VVVVVVVVVRTQVCVIVCFRDAHAEQKRGAHLAAFAPHMEAFLGRAKAAGLCRSYRVLVVT